MHISPRVRTTAAAMLLLCAVPPAFAEAIVRIGGTGIALAALQEVGASLTAAEPGVRVEILPSMGTPGGIKALIAGAIDIAVAARPLKPEEKALGLAEAACMATALVFVSSHKKASGVTLAQLPGFYADTSPNWPDGTPLKIILRSRAGSENPYLIAANPAMGAALDTAYKRQGMPVGSTDQENAKLALDTTGSFTVMTLLQVKAEHLDLNVLPLDGISPSAQTLANKTYPFPLRLCLVVSNRKQPASERFVAHLRSTAGTDLIESLGATLSD
jgi:phosphate transport system substrate-binding protein